MTIEAWPQQAHGGERPTIVTARVQAVDADRTHFRVVFRDSSGNSLTVQLPDTALRNLVETGSALLGLEPKSKVQGSGTTRAKRS